MKSIQIITFISIFIFLSCQKKIDNPTIDVRSLDVKRGDLILCGGDQFGDTSFLMSCSYRTREDFQIAISLLHSFEYMEAEKAFTKVVDSDPNCVMGYWGLAVSILNHPAFGPSKEGYSRASKVLNAATALPKSDREQAYFDAINAYYDNDWELTNHLQRAEKMEPKMEQLYLNYRDDKEAAIFYALALFATADSDDKEFTKQLKAGKILESIFPDQPNHPGIAHYIIHHYDHPELAQKALPTARSYADIAPGSAHAQHMPSHIFTRLGLWDESIESNINSASSAKCYAEEAEMNGHWGREVHALDYLVYAYLQKGDNEKAMEQFDYSESIDKIYPVNRSPYNLDAIQVRMVLENKQWAKAAQLDYRYSETQWENFPWEKALMHYARSLGSSRSGNTMNAEKELDTLNQLYQQLVQKEDEYRAEQVMTQVKASEAWINFVKGDQEKGIALMKKAVELEEETGKHPITPGEVVPAPELLGDMLLAMGKSEEALKAYELDLLGHPNRFNGIYGAAIASKQMGDQELAMQYFVLLLKLTEGSNSNRPEVAEAQKYVKGRSI